MRVHLKLIWLLSALLVGSSIGCVTVMSWFQGKPIPNQVIATSPPISEIYPTPLPTDLAEALPGQTAVFSQTQLNIFNELWQIVNDEYLYPDFNGVDWNNTRIIYEEKIKLGMTQEAFYLAMDEMIASLGDDHSVFLSPEDVAAEEATLAGNMDYVGIGVYVTPSVERKRGVIMLVFPNSPAERAGLKARDSILKVDGEDVITEDGFMLQTIQGPEGTQVTLIVQSPGEAPREVTVTRQRITGNIPVPYWTLLTSGGKRIGYILLVTFSDGTIAEQIGQALSNMGKEHPLDGLIIDNRFNEGGIDTMLIGALKYFTTGTLGHFINRTEERSLRVKGVDILGSQTVPLVLIIGPETVSFGEIFAGVLQHSGRAYLVGQPTEGNMEILWGYDFEDGSRAWIAHDSFRPLGGEDLNWEKTGILPDKEANITWDIFSFENDPAIQAALEYLARP